MASTNDIFTATPDPESIGWLHNIFGFWLDGGTTTQAVAQGVKVLGYINGFAWPMLIFIIAYGLYVGVMNTAHEGEVLGKRFSSIWLPIRTAIAGALLLPMAITGHNLSGIQVAVGAVAVEGIAVADLFWQEGYKQSFVTPVSLTPHINGRHAATQAFRSLVCARYDQTWRNSNLVTITSDGAKFADGACGSITIPKTIDSTLATSLSSAITNLVTDLQPIASNFKAMEDLDPTAQANFIAAAHRYAVNMESAISAQLDLKPAAKIDKKSVIYAANYYKESSKSQAIVHANVQVVNQAIKFDTPQDKGSYKIYGPTQRESLNSVLTIADEFLRSIDTEHFQRPGIKQVDLDIMQFIDFSLSEFIEIDEEGLYQHMGDWIKGIALDSIVDANMINDPFTLASALGHDLIAGGQAVILVATTVSIAVSGLGLMLYSLAAILIVNGMALAYWLPAMPMIIWILVLIGFLITTIELMIAAPFAAALMAEPDGQGMGRHTPKFLMMLTDLWIRLPLSIIGLFLSMAVAVAGFAIMKLVFFDAQLVQSAGIWGSIAMIALFTMTLFMIITKSLELITKIPQAALGWISDYVNTSIGNVSADDTRKTNAGADGALKQQGSSAARSAPKMGNASARFKPKNKISGG